MKNTFKKIFAATLAAATVFTMAAPASSLLGTSVVANAAITTVTNMTASPASATVTEGKTVDVTVSEVITGATAGDTDAVTVTTNDAAKATAKVKTAVKATSATAASGVIEITGVAAGSATIKVTSAVDASQYVDITVTVKSASDPKNLTGTVTDVNGISTGAANTYDVYVKTGSSYDITTGNTKIDGLKTSDKQFNWVAVTAAGLTTAFDPASSKSDGIAGISYKKGQGLTITAADKADDTVAGTTLYLAAVAGTETETDVTSGSPQITVNVHVYKNAGTLTLGDSQFSVKTSTPGNMASEINLAESGNTYVLNKGNIVSTESANFTFGQAYITGESTVNLNATSSSVATSNSTWNVTGSKIGSFNVTLQVGYLYKGAFEYASVGTVVNVKDATDLVKVIDANGNEISYTGAATSAVQKAGINLVKGQTFDLGALTGVYNGTVKVNDATFSFESNSAAVTIDKDGKGILTGAAKASGAIVTITAKEGSLELTKAHVLVNVNDLASDEITVKDGAGNTYTNVPQYVTYKDSTGASYPVNLTDTTEAHDALYNYFTNVVKSKDSKISYVTVDLVDNKSVTLTATSANGNSMPSPVIASSQTYVSNTTRNADTVVTSGLAGGKITITAKAEGYAVIKFTSQDSAKALGGTAYVFVRVLKNPEATIYGLEDTYSIATGKYVSYTSSGRTERQYALNLADKFTTNGGNVKYTLMSKSDYPNDDPTAVKVAVGVVTAYKANATAHVKITVSDASNTSTTSKIVEIKTVEPKQNTLTVSAVSGSAIDATLTIDKVTNLTVSADYQEKGISVVYDAASELDKAVLFTTDYNKNVTLYPNKDGFSVITIEAAGDGETIAPAQKQIVVTYKAKIVPSKVTGVKVSNKKGAKVAVSFKKVTTAPTMKYYVQKKVSGKTSGKSVGSTKTTLSVKKGATVKVRVKAYYYDANGVKHVGAWSSWKTLKTDKK